MSVRSLGQLTLDLVAKTGGFTGPMDRASRRTKKQMSDMGKQVEAAANKIAMLSVAAASAAATGITVMTRAGLENVDQQAKLARQLDSTIGGLRGLQLAANDAGVETGVINSAMERFSARLGEAMRGTGQAREALDRLGLSAAELAGTDVDERVALIADRVQELGLSGAETSDLLRQFGIRNREIVNLMRQGGGAIRDARQEVEDYGLAISAVDAAAIEAANDAMSRAGLLTESIRNSLAVELAPIILEIASRFNEAAREAGGLGQVVHDSVRAAIEIVARLADAFDHVNRTIHVAGVGTREFGLTVVRGMYDASRAIMEGPVNALNHMIEAMNRLPGIDIGFIDQPEMVYQAREQIEALERSIRAARQEIEDTLAADPPSVAIFEFLGDVDRRIEEMRQNIGDGPGLGEMLFDADDERALDKADQDIKKLESAYESLLDRLYPIEASQKRFREEMELLDLAAQAGDVDSLADAQRRLGDSYRNAADWAEVYGLEGQAAIEDVSRAATDMGWAFSSAFEEAIMQGEGLRDIMQGLLDDIARIALRSAVTEPLGQAIGGAFSGVFAGGGGGGNFMSQMFAAGGYTGPGNKYDPAGIVHAGEFVVQKSVVEKPGVRAMLEGLNMRGYASGGYVGPLGSGGTAGGPVTVNVYTPPGMQARTEERQDANGGRSIEVMIDEVTASNLNNPGSRTGRAMRNTFGAQRTLTGRG